MFHLLIYIGPPSVPVKTRVPDTCVFLFLTLRRECPKCDYVPREGGKSTLPQNVRRRWRNYAESRITKVAFEISGFLRRHERTVEVCFVRDSQSQQNRCHTNRL